MDIYKEMWKIAEQIESLRDSGYYPNVDMLLRGLNNQISQLVFFYNNLVPGTGGDADKTFFILENRPVEHQLISVNLNRGYPKELFDPHYCYVLKDFGLKFVVIPVTSIKPTTCVNEVFEMKIEEGDGTLCLLNFDEIRTVDSMRINTNKPFIEVKTDREKIMQKFSSIFPK